MKLKNHTGLKTPGFWRDLSLKCAAFVGADITDEEVVIRHRRAGARAYGGRVRSRWSDIVFISLELPNQYCANSTCKVKQKYRQVIKEPFQDMKDPINMARRVVQIWVHEMQHVVDLQTFNYELIRIMRETNQIEPRAIDAELRACEEGFLDTNCANETITIAEYLEFFKKAGRFWD